MSVTGKPRPKKKEKAADVPPSPVLGVSFQKSLGRKLNAVVNSVIASEAKQSRKPKAKTGSLRRFAKGKAGKPAFLGLAMTELDDDLRA
jgi:hypothetical protein